MKPRYFLTFFFSICFSILLHSQISVEGKEFLKELYYGLDVEVNSIQTMNTLNKQKENFYKLSSAGILGSNMLDADPKNNKYFELNDCQKRKESSLQLLQWYDEKTNKSLQKRIVIWCTDYSLYYSMRNLIKSISFDFREGPEKSEDNREQDSYVAYFWDNEKTAKAGANPYFVIKIYKDIASTSNCYGCGTNYVMWLTFQENNLSK